MIDTLITCVPLTLIPAVVDLAVVEAERQRHHHTERTVGALPRGGQHKHSQRTSLRMCPNTSTLSGPRWAYVLHGGIDKLLDTCSLGLTITW
jgi:hypothetical protein